MRRFPSKEFAGKVYRQITREHNIFNTSGSFEKGGRWNVKGKFGAIYTTLTKEGCRAEFERGLAIGRISPEGARKTRDMVEIEVNLSRVFDFTRKENLERMGVTRKDLASDDPTICQLLAMIIYKAGFEGVLVPSAAGTGTNLVIYPDNLDEKSKLKEITRKEFTWEGGRKSERD